MRIVITGSAGGLGSHLLQRMRAAGHTVLGIDPAGGGEGEMCIRPPTGGIYSFPFLQRTFPLLNGVPEAIILAHGITEMKFSEDHTVFDFFSVLQTNLVETFSLIQQTVKFSNGDFSVRFIAIGSASAHQAMSQSHGYVASKAGLEALMRVFARDLANRADHLFFTISPGSFEGGGMTRKALESLQQQGLDFHTAGLHLARNPLGRLASLEEIAEVVDFCLFKAPQAMSGTTFKLPMCSGVE